MAQTIVKRLRNLGINLLGVRNAALQSLVPPPLVAELLGYSYNVTQRHAEIAAQPWAGYVTSRQPPQALAALAYHERDLMCHLEELDVRPMVQLAPHGNIVTHHGVGRLPVAPHKRHTVRSASTCVRWLR